MKRNFTVFMMAALSACIMLSSCSKEEDDNNTDNTTPPADVVKPVITVAGQNPQVVTQFSVVSYVDPGATATDNVSGTVSVTSSGSVNMSSAGSYTRSYSATDAAGNTATATRTVVVNGAAYLAGTYTVQDFTGSTLNGSYPETITSSSTINNKITFNTFAYYTNGSVYGTISGTTITIPSQTVNCGNPAADRTFQGNGTYTNNFTTLTINYTETTGGMTIAGHGVYTRI